MARRMSMTVDVMQAPPQFTGWDELLALLHAAFAYQHERIDPPSSLHELDADAIARKARDERLFLAVDDGELVGCIFARPQPGSLYIGKFAVRPDRQGRGIGRQLMHAVETFARHAGYATLELNTRIELAENHASFAAMGFAKTAEHAHPGHARTTFITMTKSLARHPSSA